jgi:curved DNA-binding protein CbpA
MPDPTFRGDPYRILDVPPHSSDSAIKRRWRELAREHHPDRAAGDREVAAQLTKRMARINAAYDLLRDPGRRSRFDASPEGSRSRARAGAAEDWRSGASINPETGYPAGPPPPPPSRPVTARFDTSATLRPRNATLCGQPFTPAGQPPIRRARRVEPDELRASTPTGPVERHRRERPEQAPTLREAREAPLGFGKFRGYTLGEVELLEPAYIDWIAHTITRDRDLVQCARVIQAELDREGIARRARPPAPGFGSRAAAG